MTQHSTRPNSFPQNDCHACWWQHSCKQEWRSSLMKGNLERLKYQKYKTQDNRSHKEHWGTLKKEQKETHWHEDCTCIPLWRLLMSTPRRPSCLWKPQHGHTFLKLALFTSIHFLFGVDSPYLPTSGCLSVEVSKGGLVFTYSQRPGERWGHR